MPRRPRPRVTAVRIGGEVDYKLAIYRNQPDGWVAEISGLPGCHAVMPAAEEAVTELTKVFELIREGHRTTGTTR